MSDVGCSHEYVQPTKAEDLPDVYTQCCGCEYVLGVRKESIPEHWFDHSDENPYLQQTYRCPVCGIAASYSKREFDFHHWDYKNDIGYHLCRKCHDHIHRSQRASEQGELTDSWHRDAVRRLYKLSKENGLSFDDKNEFVGRFNIPTGTKSYDVVETILER